MTYLHKALLILATLVVLSAALVVSSTAQAQQYSKITLIYSDPDGTPIAATDVEGNVEWKVEHYPFGREYENSSQDRSSDISYAGKPYDEEIGLSYFGGRWYDPDAGRFTGIDPMPVQPNDFKSFNRYAYGFNNPYKYHDPDGNFAFLIPLAVYAGKGFAVAGAGLSGHAIGTSSYDLYSGRKTAGEAVKSAAIGVVEGAVLKGAGGVLVKAGRKLQAANDAAKGIKPDFIVDSNGTAVRNSASGARKDLEAGGFKGSSTTETLESGTLHTGVPGRDGPMDVRIMDGQAGGDPFKGPRIRTTRSGSANDGVRSDGSRFRNNESKSQRRAGSHIHLGGG